VTVYLVGAGPGDPALITVRGEQLLRSADVVVHDRLVDRRLLGLVPAGAEVVDAGKRPGGGLTQEQVNEVLVDRAARFAVVVRLKGGDPFVFGRGGEEALSLEAAGVPFEVVPGVTAAVAVPAYAGVPLTHRGLSASFTVVTGQGAGGEGAAALQWEALGRLGGTLVLLMGVAPRAEVARRLMDAGRSPDTPVLVVENGTLADQRSTRTTLEQLGSQPVAPPATIVIGEVAGLDLAWFERRPLLGWRVVVTRARQGASALSTLLSAAGAVPIELPTIRIDPPADGGEALAAAATRLGSYRWVIFTSANGVERLFSCVRDARALAGARVAAIGPGTAAALAAHGVLAELVPERYVAEGLLAVMPAPERAARVLLPRAAVARDVLPEGLRAMGYEVDVVEAYRTARPAPAPELAQAVAGADAVTFTSSSTVTGYVELMGVQRLPPVVACIGPVTAATARELGIEVTAVATEHTLAGLVEALAGVGRAGTRR
jgi:uroporphyrinogen III methyltransferase/synthase